MMKIVLFALFMVSLITSGQEVKSVGDKAPEFKAPADNGSIWELNKYLGKKFIVIYFYPAAMTGGCTKQACSYRDHSRKLQSAGVEVVGVSGDKIENLRLFKQAENLNFTLLSDEKGDVAKAFGVPVSNGGAIKRTVGGKEYELVRGVTVKRWTFIIGKNKKIIYKNEAVNAENDSEEVLSFLSQQASK